MIASFKTADLKAALSRLSPAQTGPSDAPSVGLVEMSTLDEFVIVRAFSAAAYARAFIPAKVKTPGRAIIATTAAESLCRADGQTCNVSALDGRFVASFGNSSVGFSCDQASTFSTIGDFDADARITLNQEEVRQLSMAVDVAAGDPRDTIWVGVDSRTKSRLCVTGCDNRTIVSVGDPFISIALPASILAKIKIDTGAVIRMSADACEIADGIACYRPTPLADPMNDHRDLAKQLSASSVGQCVVDAKQLRRQLEFIVGSVGDGKGLTAVGFSFGPRLLNLSAKSGRASAESSVPVLHQEGVLHWRAGVAGEGAVQILKYCGDQLSIINTGEDRAVGFDTGGDLLCYRATIRYDWPIMEAQPLVEPP